MPEARLLSLCVAGRDDNYMPDFLFRITTTLNFVARCLSRLSRLEAVEIVIADWGSDIPLSEKLELSPEARQVCRFLYVPKQVIKDTQQGAEYYHVARACNFALRRSRGQFVFLANTDQILSESSLDSLLRLLEGKITSPIDLRKAFMIVPRVQIPWQFLDGQPSLDDFERYIFLNDFELPHEPSPPSSYWFTSSSGYIVSSSLNQSLRGLDERHAGWGGGDIEFAFRAIQENQYFYLSSIGVKSYHMGHPPVGSRHTRAISNPLIWHSESSINGEDWGIGHYECMEHISATALHDNSAGDSKKESTAQEGPEQLAARLEGETQSEKATAFLADMLEYFISRGILFSNHDALAILAWYSTSRFPRRFLDVGTGNETCRCIVAGGSPRSEIYAIEEMHGEMPGEKVLGQLSNVWSSGLKSRFHLVNGSPETGLRRVKGMLSADDKIDLIHLGVAAIERLNVISLKDILGLLSSNGAIVLSGNSARDFLPSWKKIVSDLMDVGCSAIAIRGRQAGIVALRGPNDEIPPDGSRDQTINVTFDKVFALIRKRESQRSAELCRQIPHLFASLGSRTVRKLRRTFFGMFDKQ
jgi:hypothetical protein